MLLYDYYYIIEHLLRNKLTKHHAVDKHISG